MNTLPLTLAMLLLLTLMTLGRLQRSVDETVLRDAGLMHTLALRELDNEMEHSLYKIKVRTRLPPGTHPKRNQSTKKEHEKTDDNKGGKAEEFPSKFNLRPLLTKSSDKYEAIFLNLLQGLFPEWITSRELAEGLLRELQKKVHNLGLPGEPTGPLTRAEQLGCLQFEDEALQTLMFTLLHPPESDRSLLDHVAIERKKTSRVNIVFATKPLLLAIFQNEELVEDIQKIRQELLDSDESTEDKLTAPEKKFEQAVKESMALHGIAEDEYSGLLDYKFKHRPGSITVTAEGPKRASSRDYPAVRLKRYLQVDAE